MKCLGVIGMLLFVILTGGFTGARQSLNTALVGGMRANHNSWRQP